MMVIHHPDVFTMMILRRQQVVDPQWRGSVNVTSKVFHSPSQVDYGWPADAGAYAASEDYQKLSYGFRLIRDIFLGDNSFAEKHIESEIVPGGPEKDFMHAAQVQVMMSPRIVLPSVILSIFVMRITVIFIFIITLKSFIMM